jgi:hypothetical protein
LKNITLLKLALTNFQGGTFTLDADGADADVYGANGVGKTRLASAFSWLLFDKDSLGRADFEIKNLDANGQEEHGLEHSVEAELSANGNSITLKKMYHEIWSKKRGSAQAQFTGHTTDYFVNGVPCQKKEYTEQVVDLAGDESVFRLLTSPTAFPALHWQKQRTLLMEVCGNISDAQVIESDQALFPLSSILMQRSIDDHRKVVAARRSEINKELEKIPVRIDEQKRMMPDIPGLNRKEIEAQVAALETTLNDAKLRLQGIDTGGNLAQLSKNLTGITTDIAKLENIYYQDGMKAVARLNQQIGDLTFKKGEADRRANGIKGDIEAKQRRIDDAEQRLQLLREEWERVDGEGFQDTTEQVCVACGQDLPADRVQEARVKALAEFNRKKAERLEEITTKGKRLSEEQARDKEAIVTLQHLEIPETTFDADIERLTSERDAVKKAAEDYSMVPGRPDLIAKMAEIEIRIKAEKDGVAVDREKINGEVAVLTAQLNEAKAKADLFPKREQGEKRIEELKADEKRLAAEFEKLEQELYLTEQFVRTKVRLLTDRINSKFEIARFKLFETQVNGGIAECCEITVNGIPYNGGLNNAARINAGLDVCRTLSQHYGLHAPVFVDNAESVCQLTGMDAQVIRLIVSEKDAALRVEAKQVGTLFGKRVAA